MAPPKAQMLPKQDWRYMANASKVSCCALRTVADKVGLPRLVVSGSLLLLANSTQACWSYSAN